MTEKHEHNWVRFDIVTGSNEWEDFTDKHRKCSECGHTQKRVYVKREDEDPYRVFPEWQDTDPFEPQVPVPPVPTYDPNGAHGGFWYNVRDEFYRG